MAPTLVPLHKMCADPAHGPRFQEHARHEHTLFFCCTTQQVLPAGLHWVVPACRGFLGRPRPLSKARRRRDSPQPSKLAAVWAMVHYLQ